MDIARLSMNMAQENTMRSFGFGVMRMQMDQAEQTGEQIAQLVQATQALSMPSESTVNILA